MGIAQTQYAYGVKVGAGEFQSKAAAEHAGKQALQRFLEDREREARRK
jgi:hypothetical protein